VRLRLFVCLVLVFMLNGCLVFPDYSLSSYDYKQIEESLRIKALEKKIERSKIVNDVGYKLLKGLPLKEKKNQCYVGILATPLDKYVSQLYDVQGNLGKILVYGVVKGSQAEKAGLQEKDIIVSINNKRISKRNFDNIIKSFSETKQYRFVLNRDGQRKDISIIPESVYFNVPFVVSESAEVNTFASPLGITVTYGMLNFIDNDDELGVVMAHELAHLIRSHLLKGSSVGLFSKILAIAIGGVEIPQSGDLGNIAERTSSNLYSDKMEKEADFIGVLYAEKAGFDVESGMSVWERFAIEMPQRMDSYFGATHPNSTKRLLRLKDVISRIKNGSINEEEYLK